MYKYINHIYIYGGQGGGRECFPIPASLTFGDKILSPTPSLNIASYPRSKLGGSPQGSVPAGNIAIPSRHGYHGFYWNRGSHERSHKRWWWRRLLASGALLSFEGGSGCPSFGSSPLFG